MNTRLSVKAIIYIFVVFAVVQFACVLAPEAAPVESLRSSGAGPLGSSRGASPGEAVIVEESAPSGSSAKSLSAGEAPALASDTTSGGDPAPESLESLPPELQQTGGGILTAGDVDDNLNFPFYQNYLSNVQQNGSDLPYLPVMDRVTLHIFGDDRVGLGNAWVRITPEGGQTPILEAYAGADGRFQFFPDLDGAGEAARFTVEAGTPDERQPLASTSLDLESLGADRSVEIEVPGLVVKHPQSLDLMLVIDTTGSMSDELSYLTSEFLSIVDAVRGQFPEIDMRFGLILYRDEGDDYVVRNLGWTDSASEMQTRLKAQSSNGGGDYPEAVHKALAEAVESEWREGNVARVLFHVADAPPHPNFYTQTLEQAQIARQKGIHIYPLAASGVADEAEYIMRLSALITHGRYLFLTDDSGVGNTHAEPKILCYVVTHLDDLMVRVITGELAGTRLEPGQDEIIRTVGTYEAGVCGE